jgi:hypothetical protein
VGGCFLGSIGRPGMWTRLAAGSHTAEGAVLPLCCSIALIDHRGLRHACDALEVDTMSELGGVVCLPSIWCGTAACLNTKLEHSFEPGPTLPPSTQPLRKNHHLTYGTDVPIISHGPPAARFVAWRALSGSLRSQQRLPGPL